MRVSDVVLSDEEAAEEATKAVRGKGLAAREEASDEALKAREEARSTVQAEYARLSGMRSV